MRKIIAVICALALVISGLCVIPAAAQEAVFEDTLENLDSVSEKIGNWDCFQDHAEFHLSVAGRTNTSSENSLIYKFTNQAVTSLTVDTVVYSGFVNTASYAVFARVNSEWTALETEASAESDISGYESLNFKSVTLSANNIPEGATAIKITLKNDPAWVLFIDNVRAQLVDYESRDDGGEDSKEPAGGETDAEAFVDPLDNWNLVSSRTDGWDLFNPNTQQENHSVIGRNSVNKTAAVYYSFKGKSITAAELVLSYHPDGGDISSVLNNFDVEVRSGSEEWTKLSFAAGEASALGKEFYTVAVTASDMPKDITELRITLNNEVLYALFIDEVRLGLKDGKTDVEEKSWNLIDSMKNWNYVADHSDNFEFHTPHEETGLNVIGKKNAKRGYVSYRFNGGLIKDFNIEFQVAAEYFLQERDLLIQYRIKGEDKFNALSVLCGRPTAVAGPFSLMSVTPAETLPENVEEIKIFLYNDVAWTLMINEVKLNVDGLKQDSVISETGKKPSEPEIPVTGDNALPLALLINIILSSAFVVFCSRRSLLKQQ